MPPAGQQNRTVFAGPCQYSYILSCSLNTNIENHKALKYGDFRAALNDALEISVVNPHADINMGEQRLITGTTSNMPAGCAVGIREFYYYNQNWYVIRILELSPVLGRTWYNRYDNVTKKWYGWVQGT